MPNASRTSSYKQETINSRRRSLKFKVSSLKLKPSFTLIELLIAIVIIGILGSIVSLAIINHQKKARDVQRKNDLLVVKKALETAKNDCNNAAYYPNSALSANGTINYQTHLLTSYLLNTGTKYLRAPINDPNFNPTTFTNGYQYSRPATVIAGSIAKCPNPTTGAPTFTGTSAWVLRAKLENTSDTDSAKTYDLCQTSIGTVFNAWGGIPPAPNGDGYYYVCNE